MMLAAVLNIDWQTFTDGIALGAIYARLFRKPELIFQIFNQLQEALCGDGIVEQGDSPLGLFQPPL